MATLGISLLETEQTGWPCGDWRACPVGKVPHFGPTAPQLHTLAVGGLADCVCEFPGVWGRGGWGVPRLLKLELWISSGPPPGRLDGESLLLGQEKASQEPYPEEGGPAGLCPRPGGTPPPSQWGSSYLSGALVPTHSLAGDSEVFCFY